MMANRMPDEDGRIVLTPMLNEAGRIIGDFSVTRLGPQEYFLVGDPGSTERFHLRWWERRLPASGVELESMMARLAGFAIAGPRARGLLERLADRDVSNDALPFFTGCRMQVGPVPDVIVLRVSYSGELGYELYLPPEHQIALFLALHGEGAELGLRCAGMRALGSLRAEKGFAGWGRELSPDYDPFQAGLGRFVKLDKDGFIGRDAALRAAERGPDERLVLFEIDADDTDPCADPWGGEPVLREGEYVGYLTSAGYGHCAGRTLALGYVRSEAIASNAAYDVELLRKAASRAPARPAADRSRRAPDARLSGRERAHHAGRRQSEHCVPVSSTHRRPGRSMGLPGNHETGATDRAEARSRAQSRRTGAGNGDVAALRRHREFRLR